MLRVNPIHTSVERTVASATTGTVSDGGCDNVDMTDRTYWLRVGKPCDRRFGFRGVGPSSPPVDVGGLCVQKVSIECPDCRHTGTKKGKMSRVMSTKVSGTMPLSTIR